MSDLIGMEQATKDPQNLTTPQNRIMQSSHQTAIHEQDLTSKTSAPEAVQAGNGMESHVSAARSHASRLFDAQSINSPAGSTLNGYMPSVMERRGLLSNGPSNIQYRHKKSKSRQAFEGGCRVVNIVFPIDVDHDKTEMQSSSIAKLVRAAKDIR